MDLIANSDTPAIVGLGSTGLSIARYFHKRGQDFMVFDSRENPPGLAELQRECPQAQVVLGQFDRQRLLMAGRLVVSPGIALSEPAIANAIAAGVPACGDIDLFCAEATAPVVGITGSNAKSTVTELLGRMARRAGIEVAVGGNLGTPALDLLADSVQCYILELSSFQLERAGVLGLEVATVLNLSEDHLDRHGRLSVYQAAKQRIFCGCNKLVCNRDDAMSFPRATPVVVSAPADISTPVPQCWTFGLSEPGRDGFGLLVNNGVEWLVFESELLMPVSELALLGRHNISNALAALALGTAIALPLPVMLEELREFGGLPHRCQLVATTADVRYVNDSKATNPGATLAALQGLGQEQNILLIAGGQGKGADFSVLAEAVTRYCKAAILLGEDAAELERDAASTVPSYRASSMAEAVTLAARLAAPGDVVLLSPACASFDMFSGFEERGRQFAACALAQLSGGDAA